MDIQLVIGLASVIATAFVGPIAVDLAREWINKRKKKKDLLRESLDMDELIVKSLEDLKIKHSANRVWIAQYHNGGYFYPTGKSMQKFSMTYEQVDNNTSSVIERFQNIPVSLFTKTVNKLYDGDYIICDDNNESKFGITKIFGEGTVKVSIMVPIITLKDTFIGVLGMDFSNEKTFSYEEITDIKLEIASISGVLMNYLKS